RRWSMAIAWSRISSKVIAIPPYADAACRRRPQSWCRPPAASGPQHSTSAPEAKRVRGCQHHAEWLQMATTAGESHDLFPRFPQERSAAIIHAPGLLHIGGTAYVCMGVSAQLLSPVESTHPLCLPHAQNKPTESSPLCQRWPVSPGSASASTRPPP